MSSYQNYIWKLRPVPFCNHRSSNFMKFEDAFVTSVPLKRYMTSTLTHRWTAANGFCLFWWESLMNVTFMYFLKWITVHIVRRKCNCSCFCICVWAKSLHLQQPNDSFKLKPVLWQALHITANKNSAHWKELLQPQRAAICIFSPLIK